LEDFVLCVKEGVCKGLGRYLYECRVVHSHETVSPFTAGYGYDINFAAFKGGHYGVCIGHNGVVDAVKGNGFRIPEVVVLDEDDS
jgi:hypothetical protein